MLFRSPLAPSSGSRQGSQIPRRRRRPSPFPPSLDASSPHPESPQRPSTPRPRSGSGHDPAPTAVAGAASPAPALVLAPSPHSLDGAPRLADRDRARTPPRRRRTLGFILGPPHATTVVVLPTGRLRARCQNPTAPVSSPSPPPLPLPDAFRRARPRSRPWPSSPRCAWTGVPHARPLHSVGCRPRLVAPSLPLCTIRLCRHRATALAGAPPQPR